LGGWGERPALVLSAIATAAGLAAVACSAMVYHATRRPFWHRRPTLARFAGTAMLLGPLVLLVAASWGDARGIGLGAAMAAMAVAAIKLRGESTLLGHADDLATSPATRSARLLKGPLAGVWRLRRTLGVTGGVLLPALWMGLGRPMIPLVGQAVAMLALTVATAGELAERVLFFAAVVRPKMPGGVS
jgi:DMSO reductase anchor subunit